MLTNGSKHMFGIAPTLASLSIFLPPWIKLCAEYYGNSVGVSNKNITLCIWTFSDKLESIVTGLTSADVDNLDGNSLSQSSLSEKKIVSRTSTI